MTNINKTIEDFDKKYITNSKCNGGGCCIKLNKHSLKDFIIKALKAQEQEHQKKLEGKIYTQEDLDEAYQRGKYR